MKCIKGNEDVSMAVKVANLEAILRNAKKMRQEEDKKKSKQGSDKKDK